MNLLARIQRAMTLPLSAKDLSDWIKVGVIIGSIAAGYADLRAQVRDTSTAVRQLEQQTARIERYLSSADPLYWQKARAQNPGDESP